VQWISPLISEARGKLGGSVFARNSAGQYIRAKTQPANPQTASQQANRALFATASKQWSLLSVATRQQWSTAAANMVRRDSLGQKFTPSGFNTYVRAYLNIQTYGSGVAPSGPYGTGASPDIAVLTLFAFPIGSGKALIQVSKTTGAAWPGAGWKAWASLCQPPGVSFMGPAMYRRLGAPDSVSGGTMQLENAYFHTFGAQPWTVGTRLFVKIAHVDDNTGFESQPGFCNILVT
jgi:hypothetical protein